MIESSRVTTVPDSSGHQAVGGIGMAAGWLIWLVILMLSPQASWAGKCLYVSSYHHGYAWSDGVERGLRKELQGKCELRQFDMDTKRNKSTEYIKQRALEVKALIEDWQPDVVITADDNAAKYLIKEHYREHILPFVFCGVNWTVKEYGFPYSNVTGMIEIAPIEPILKKVQSLQSQHSNAIYIGANTLTEMKNYKRFQEATTRLGMKLQSRLVDTADEWLTAYKEAQQYDFIIMGSKSGISGWDTHVVQASIVPISQKLSITNHGWMMPYTMLGYTKIPEEQGEWAAHAALSILAGTRPSDIAIVPNRKWDIWSNPELLEAADIKLPKNLLRKSKQLLTD